jgi:hypothetical protein
MCIHYIIIRLRIVWLTAVRVIRALGIVLGIVNAYTIIPVSRGGSSPSSIWAEAIAGRCPALKSSPSSLAPLAVQVVATGLGREFLPDLLHDRPVGGTPLTDQETYVSLGWEMPSPSRSSSAKLQHDCIQA